MALGLLCLSVESVKLPASGDAQTLNHIQRGGKVGHDHHAVVGGAATVGKQRIEHAQLSRQIGTNLDLFAVVSQVREEALEIDVLALTFRLLLLQILERLGTHQPRVVAQLGEDADALERRTRAGAFGHGLAQRLGPEKEAIQGHLRLGRTAKNNLLRLGRQIFFQDLIRSAQHKLVRNVREFLTKDEEKILLLSFSAHLKLLLAKLTLLVAHANVARLHNGLLEELVEKLD